MRQSHQTRFSIETRGHRHMHDLTVRVADIIRESEIQTGIAHVFNVGSTGAIGTIEFEPGLEQDLPDTLEPPDAAEPRVWARESMARWQWPFASASDRIGAWSVASGC